MEQSRFIAYALQQGNTCYAKAMQKAVASCVRSVKMKSSCPKHTFFQNLTDFCGLRSAKGAISCLNHGILWTLGFQTLSFLEAKLKNFSAVDSFFLHRNKY